MIFVDESVDHNLTSTDKSYPIFVLDFCIFEKTSYADSIVPKVQEFKFKYFGHDIVVLHEQDIRRQKVPFVFLKSRPKQDAFMDGLNTLIEEINFIIIATVINKHQLSSKYADPENPYELGLKFCMERAYTFIQGRKQQGRTTHIVVEKRGRREDNNLELAFRRIRDGWNYKGAMPEFELVFADKRVNSTGLQLADLTARPIGRHVMSPTQSNRAWEAIEKKLLRDRQGNYRGWGLKIFP